MRAIAGASTLPDASSASPPELEGVPGRRAGTAIARGTVATLVLAGTTHRFAAALVFDGVQVDHAEAELDPPVGTLERLIGGDPESKPFAVGPHVKLVDIAGAAETENAGAIAAFGNRTVIPPAGLPAFGRKDLGTERSHAAVPPRLRSKAIPEETAGRTASHPGSAQPASRKRSAVSRSTETSCETPRSAIVTPKRRFILAMVIGLWVMTTKRVAVERVISSSRSQ